MCLLLAGMGALEPFLDDYWRGAWADGSLRAAWVLATVYLSFASFRFFSSYVLGVVGQGGAIVIGAAGYAAFAGLVAVTGSFPLLAAAAVGYGFAAACVWSGSANYVLDVSPGDGYGRSSQRLYLAARGGILIGVLGYGALVALGLGWALPAIAAAACAAAAMIVLGLPTATHDEGREGGGGFWREFRALAGGEGALVACFLFLGASVLGLFIYLFVTYTVDSLGRFWVAVVTFPFFVAAVPANLWAGSLSDRVGRRWLFAAGFASGAAGMLMLAGAGRLAPGAGGGAPLLAVGLIVAGSLLMGVQAAVVPTVAMAWVGDRTGRGRRARTYGMTFAANDLGVAAAILGSAYLAKAASAGWALAAFAAVSVVCAGLSFLVRPVSEE
jgi:MFS family permease